MLGTCRGEDTPHPGGPDAAAKSDGGPLRSDAPGAGRGAAPDRAATVARRSAWPVDATAGATVVDAMAGAGSGTDAEAGAASPAADAASAEAPVPLDEPLARGRDAGLAAAAVAAAVGGRGGSGSESESDASARPGIDPSEELSESDDSPGPDEEEPEEVEELEIDATRALEGRAAGGSAGVGTDERSAERLGGPSEGAITGGRRGSRDDTGGPASRDSEMDG